MAVKYFFSGASGIRAEVLPEVAAILKHRLLSMHESFKGNTRVWCDITHDKRCGLQEIMLDSGAFTAFTKGKKVQLDDLIRIYDDTLRKINPRIKVWLINLDVIPGAPGRVAEPEELQQALDDSDANFKILKKRYGDRVLPVYHQTEPEERLIEVAKMSSYIGMGFRQNFAEEHRIRHAETSLAICKRMGVRTHGLATTGYKMLSRTTFDSVDSASWLYAAAMGKILVLNQRGEITMVPISAQSPMQKDYRQHFATYPPEEQQYIVDRLTDAKIELAQVQNDLSYRILFTARELSEWLESYLHPTLKAEVGLFSA